jgi:hypothetical protein
VRLAREDEGRAAPHPLRIVFPAKEPVYPMRLTALAGGTTAVRLYVIAGEGRIATGLKVIFRDRFLFGPRGARAPGDEGWARSEGLGKVVSHPRLLPDMWDGCVLTHLDGDFRSADMERDLVLAAGSSKPLLARYWSREGARDAAAAWALGSWALLSLVLLFVRPAHLPLKGRRGNPFLPCLLVLSLAAGGAFLAIRASLPTIDVMVVRDRGDRWDRSPAWVMGKDVPEKDAPDFAAMPNAAVEEYLRPRIPLGDSPGQAEVINRPGVRVVRFYGEAGEPTDWSIPPVR